LGHRLAGEWLEQVGEPRAAVIAEQFERSGDPARAAGAYQRAAAQALAANDLAASLSWTERALGLGQSGEARGQLALLRSEAHYWRGELNEAGSWVLVAIESLRKGSAPWYAALGQAVFIAGRLGQRELLAMAADEIVGAWSEDEVDSPSVMAAVQAT